MSKEIESILAFIGGCCVIWTVVFFGWRGLAAVCGMIALYYILDIVSFIFFSVCIVGYLIVSRCFGVNFSESMAKIDRIN